jgi:hypothetical protein
MQDMHVENPMVAARSVNSRARDTNDPFRFRGLDGRTRAGRRRADLIEQFIAELGGADAVNPVMMLKIRRAAELAVVSEELRAATMRGALHSDVALLSLARIEGMADRALRRLRLDQKREPAAAPGLREYLASAPVRSPVDRESPP